MDSRTTKAGGIRTGERDFYIMRRGERKEASGMRRLMQVGGGSRM